ncbi:MAG: 50S ribosomal protein L10, partial [Candidatus Aenigmarchaeota archaeon]|nr:50S ribosomal protein L10 [Candidatus Aenigmarchaeota archaeon]
FSNSNPFELAKLINSAKSKAAAKPGDIAPADIMISAGPTNLPPGPAISELQKAGLPAGVEGGKVAIKKDTVIVRAGKEIKKEVAGILAKLSIEPMEISLDLLAVYDNGTIYDKSVLFIPPEKYLEDLKAGFCYGLSLSVKINYYTPDNIKVFLSKAHVEGKSLAVKAGYLTKDTVGPILAKAVAEASSVQKHLKA